MKYPNLKDNKVLSIDIETYDPKLLDYGPGIYRKDGKILGVAVTTEDGFSEYYDIGHDQALGGHSQDVKDKNIKYLKDQLSGSNKKLGANLMYDLDWLQNGYGIIVGGEYHDVQYAEPLIDEHSYSFSLDNLAKKYLGKQKKKSRIEAYAEEQGWKKDARAHLYKMPYEMVREYALEDTVLPIEIFRKQWQIMRDEDLLNVYHMEIGLTPLMLQMRKTGVRVDQDAVVENRLKLNKRLREVEEAIFKAHGEFNYNSSKQLAELFDKNKVNYPLTDKGNPSIDVNVLLASAEALPVCGTIVEAKRIKRVVSSVFDNILLNDDVCINGRIHGMFHQLKKDGKGTITGRFSGSNPNLQNQPSKKDRYGHECRSAYIPEEGHLWGSLDYSQIEYRGLAHYATGPKSGALREKFNSDPKADYHQIVMDWTNLERKLAKNFNFGSMYGMGVTSMAQLFGWNQEKTQELYELYHTEMPYVKYTMNQVQQRGKERGYVKTIMGRRGRANDYIKNNNKYYIMLNKLIQGSAADVMKKGMLDAYNAGVFNVLHPHLTVHDEIDVSIPQRKEGKEAVKHLAHCMENCVQLRVPIRADIEIGENWADVSGDKAKEFLE